MNIEITTSPKFHFSICGADLDVLSKLAERHYDAVCRGLVATADGSGRLNGRLTVWRRQLDVSQELAAEDGAPVPREVAVSAEFRDLDTILKSMEMAPHHCLSNDELARVHRLRQSFMGALLLSNQKYHEWKAEYVGPALNVKAA